MARMHSRKKGRSKSKRPIQKKLSWVKYKPKEIELLVVKYAKEGNAASQIGMILRDKYGIPDVKELTKKSVTDILSAHKLQTEVPEDLLALIKKAVLIRKHREINKQDMPAFRGLQLTESKIKRLTKYYKKSGKLSQSWKYDPEKVKLLVQ